jgi:restriction system protein
MTRGYGPRADEMGVEDWLSTLDDDSDGLAISSAFPNEKVKAAYLESVPARADGEVRDVLRQFLMRTGELGSDDLRVEWLKHLFLEDDERFGKAMTIEYNRRLVGLDPSGEPAWQGLSWILDLLPRWPMKAIEVLEAYFLAHMMQLPDGRISGISDAQALIRAMWIGNPTSGAQKRDVVFQLGSVRFEHLVESLYSAMGFTTKVTARSKDGGRDIEVVRDDPSAKEHSLVECKLWHRPVGVTVARRLLGVVAHERSTKGVLVSTSSFTKPARDLVACEPRLELLGWKELLCLLDEHLGADWGLNVDAHITDSMSRTGFDGS